MNHETTLGALALVANGKTPSKSDQRESGHPVLKIRDVDDLGLFKGEFQSYVDVRLAEKFSQKQVVQGDCLILNAAHNADYVGSKTFYCGREVEGALATGEWLMIRPRQTNLEPRYLFHWINHTATRRALREMVKGIHLYPKDVARLKIPLPPLEEQKRIAAILDEADDLRTKRRESLAQLDTLLQSTFLDLFGDPVTNPKGWDKVAVGEFAKVKGGKRLPKGEDYADAPTGYRYIRVSDISPNRIDESDLRNLKPETQKKIARYIVEFGDVIITIAGTIGLTAAVPVSLDGVNLTENAAKIVPNDKRRVNATYLSYALQMPHAQSQIRSHTGQVTIGKLALFRIEKLEVLLPPEDKQKRFAEFVSETESQRRRMTGQLDELDTLFASLQSRAFRGEL